jgi:hypothetical protein
VSLLKANRDSYPWEGRRDEAVFRGEVYGRSCWDGSPGGRIGHRDSIVCGRPRLLYLGTKLRAAGEIGAPAMPACLSAALPVASSACAVLRVQV